MVEEELKLLLVKSGVLCLAKRTSFQGIRNPFNDSNPESKLLRQGIHSVESSIQETVLDYLTRGEVRTN